MGQGDSEVGTCIVDNWPQLWKALGRKQEKILQMFGIKVLQALSLHGAGVRPKTGPQWKTPHFLPGICNSYHLCAELKQPRNETPNPHHRLNSWLFCSTWNVLSACTQSLECSTWNNNPALYHSRPSQSGSPHLKILSLTPHRLPTGLTSTRISPHREPKRESHPY
jgi:hypothetical protein